MKTTEQKIPALRFPEFEGEWEEKKLGEVVVYVKGFAFKSDDYTDSGTRIIRVSDLDKDSIKQTNDQIFISDEHLKIYSKYLILKNDIIITTVGSRPDMEESAVGRGILIREDFVGFLNQNMLKLNSSEKIVNPFLFGYINTSRYRKHINAIHRGNANQSNITLQELLEYKFSFPSLSEQQKIADFLSATDKRLELLKEKKKCLEDYKRGAMQRIFSQELRFTQPDGSAYPDWEEKKLGEVSKLVKGKQLNAEYLDGNSIFPVINGGINPSGYYFEYNTPENTITISEGGNSCGFVNFIRTKFWSGGHCYTLREIKVNMNPFFLYQTLKHEQTNIMRLRVGSGLPNIQKGDIEKFEIPLPSLPEQTQIANFLSAIDSKIEKLSEQIASTESYKKGLLQQMFV